MTNTFTQHTHITAHKRAATYSVIKNNQKSGKQFEVVGVVPGRYLCVCVSITHAIASLHRSLMARTDKPTDRWMDRQTDSAMLTRRQIAQCSLDQGQTDSWRNADSMKTVPRTKAVNLP